MAQRLNVNVVNVEQQCAEMEDKEGTVDSVCSYELRKAGPEATRAWTTRLSQGNCSDSIESWP